MDDLTVTRLSLFIGLLLFFTCLETLRPARGRVMNRRSRWTTNVSLSVLGSLVGALLSPILAVTVAAVAEQNGWGVLNWVQVDPWIEGLIAVILLDFAIWLQHVGFHHIAWLWRLHSVHHTDRDLDATSGVRFHPAEIAVSLVWKALIILAVGPSVLAVIIFEIVLNGSAIFTHSNLSLPKPIDRVARWMIVTPDMHRIHHSVIEPETNSNFGFNLSIWDRLFRTYRKTHQGVLTLGLSEHQTDRPARLWPMLWLPFQR